MEEIILKLMGKGVQVCTINDTLTGKLTHYAQGWLTLTDAKGKRAVCQRRLHHPDEGDPDQILKAYRKNPVRIGQGFLLCCLWTQFSRCPSSNWAKKK